MSSKKNFFINKALLSISLFIVMIISISFVYKHFFNEKINQDIVIENNQIDTSDWDSIESKYGGFVLNIPPDTQATGVGIGPPTLEEANEVAICKGCDSSINFDTNPQTSSVRIKIFEIKETVFKDMSLEEISSANFKHNTEHTSEFTKITFGGEKAYSYKTSNGYVGTHMGVPIPTGHNRVIETMKNGMYYIFVYTDEPTENKIISTFRFTR